MTKLHNKIYKKEFNIIDVITHIDRDIDTIIEDSTKYFENVEFQICFKNCDVTVEGELNWIYNEVPEVVDFIRLNVHESFIDYESGSEGKLNLHEIRLIEQSVRIG